MKFVPAPDVHVVIPAGLAERFRGPANPEYEWGINDHGQRLSVLHYEAENARADFIVQTGLGEPKEKFSELHSDLYRRGFSVHAMDWPFQGMSDGAPDHRRRHTNGIHSDIGDFARFVEHVRSTRGSLDRPLVVMGHSYGSHVIAQYVSDEGHKADGVFLSAAMCDFNFFPQTNISALSMWGPPLYNYAKTLALCKGDDAYAPGSKDWSAKDRDEGPDIFSNDPVRKHIHNLWIAANPKMQVGRPTLGWVIDAVEQCRLLRAKDFSHLRIPFTAAVADGEVISQQEPMRELARRVPNGEVLDIADCLHEMWMCDDASRNTMLGHINKMVAKLEMA